MPIQIEEPRVPGHPVVKRQAIGETFVGALVAQEQRPVQKVKDGVATPVLKPDGKPRQEQVLTLVAMPGTTAQAGIGDTTNIPNPGDLVRIILRGGGFADWLDAKKALGRPLNVGDIVEQNVTFAQVYDANGNAEGAKLTTQAQAAAVPRAKSLGFYGPITLRGPQAADMEWVAKAEAAYMAARQQSAPQLDEDVI